MNINDKKQVIGYLLVAGFAAYICSAMLSAIFIIAVDQDEGWCLEFVEFQTGTDSYEVRCVEFKNRLEEYKSYHNLEMRERNKYLIGGNFILFLAITCLLFYFIPKWQGEIDHTKDATTFLLLSLSFGIVIIMPLFFWLCSSSPYRVVPRYLYRD